MIVFEWIVALLGGAVLLAALARRLTVPYPTLLALGGAALAFVPWAPHIELDPELALALFVAPILLDSGFDTSLRDLKINRVPIAGLVFIAVGVTTVVTALVARALVPELGWAAAIALGAIVAPPDAAAATSILKQVRPPHRLMTILEGESLLNDATSLVVYRIAVGAAIGAHTSLGSATLTAVLGVLGSIIVGPLLANVTWRLLARITDVPTAIIVQFVSTFALWIIAERLHLSAVLTVVTYAMTLGRLTPASNPARLRVPSFAFWETTVFVLNVLAFVLVGLQIGPILARLNPADRSNYFLVAGIILAAVIGIRIAWVMLYNTVVRWRVARASTNANVPLPTVKGGVLISWCGMRGIVTLAAALALPDDFPRRDLLLLVAFTVTIGTLVIQGLTLPWLLKKLNFQEDDPVAREIREARMAAFSAALQELASDQSESAKALKVELEEALSQARDKKEGPAHIDELRRRATHVARMTIISMRDGGQIGDAAFQKVEEELDHLDLAAE